MAFWLKMEMCFGFQILDLILIVFQPGVLADSFESTICDSTWIWTTCSYVYKWFFCLKWEIANILIILFCRWWAVSSYTPVDCRSWWQGCTTSFIKIHSRITTQNWQFTSTNKSSNYTYWNESRSRCWKTHVKNSEYFEQPLIGIFHFNLIFRLRRWLITSASYQMPWH